jgi:hypothetical protein
MKSSVSIYFCKSQFGLLLVHYFPLIGINLSYANLTNILENFEENGFGSVIFNTLNAFLFITRYYFCWVFNMSGKMSELNEA